MNELHYEVTNPSRLDQFLGASMQIARNQVEQLIEKGCVCVDGKVIVKKSYKLSLGNALTINLPQAPVFDNVVVDFDVPVLYEDDELMVINKPKNLVVHPAPSVKEATVVDWLKAKGIRLSTVGGEERNGIVHRIDKDTTGALVIAKNNESHSLLSEQLQDKTMGRYYLAIVTPPLKEECIVDKPIARDPHQRLRMGIVSGGREAKSAFIPLATSRDEKFGLVAVKLFTGRTHQIRVHLKSIGRIIGGDLLYGFNPSRVKIDRPFLHAYVLYLVHPKSGQRLFVYAPMANDMKQFLDANFDIKDSDEILQPNTLINRFSDDGGVLKP
jgi:23S rRNA pseudouridine1911/1915/1917 synthase